MASKAEKGLEISTLADVNYSL